jgi:hypothetical protein
MELDESASLSGEDPGGDPGTAASDPFGAARAPDPFLEPTRPKQKAATKKAVAAVSPRGTAQYGAGFDKGGGILKTFTDVMGWTRPEDPSLPGDEGEYGGQKYKFSEVSPAAGDPVEYYSAGDQSANTADTQQGPHELTADLEKVLGGVQNPQDISPNEYAKLTEAAHKGNKLAQQILVGNHFKANGYPSIGQDLAKVADPFVQALSNLPNLAGELQTHAQAVTQPYDFTNAESQVNNILTNQMGMKAAPPPSAATTAFSDKLDQIAAGNPMTTSVMGLPSITGALAGLGPAAKLSEKATPNAALLSALLSHLQYQDVYGTGLSSTSAANNPAWLQALLASVVQSSGLGGALPSVASLTGTTPTTTTPGAGTSPTPNA